MFYMTLTRSGDRLLKQYQPAGSRNGSGAYVYSFATIQANHMNFGFQMLKAVYFNLIHLWKTFPDLNISRKTNTVFELAI
jgi:hypothetical protein